MDEEGEWVENDEALRKSVDKDRTLCRMLLKKKSDEGGASFTEFTGMVGQGPN